MRIKTINIYTINEHPNQEACFEWIRNNWHDLGQYCVDDMVCSLKELAKATGGKLDYSISIAPDRGEFVSLEDFDAETLAELVKVKDDCPLTGMCYDIDVIEGLMSGKLESNVLTLLHKEGEYLYSDAGLCELCEANGYEFLEDGSLA